MKNIVISYFSGDIIAKLEHGERTLVHDVGFSVHESESLALVGETGSGKTMTALSILRLLPANVTMRGGRILFDGQDLLTCGNMNRFLGTRIVYIPQNGLEFLNPARSIRQHLYDSLKKLGVSGSALKSAALEKLRIAGFDAPEKIIGKYPFQLSGGMAQRVAIAISACSEAKLILADEPTNGLDAEGRIRFMHLLNELFPSAAKIIITHDIGIAALCDRALVLLGGKMMENGPAETVLQSPRHPYTRALLGALVENGMVQTPVLRTADGECPFYARCEQACSSCLSKPAHRIDAETEWWCSGK